MTIQNKIDSRSLTVGVIGLGYVGLPLVIAYAGAGHRVIGFDIDATKVTRLNAGESYIEHIGSEPIRAALDAGNFEATTDFSRADVPDVLIICVPTPLSHHHEPDLSFVVSTIDAICPHLRKGQVLSLESTTYPGTTDEEILPRLEARGLVAGTDVFVVYSPEREDPGNREFHGTSIPKVIGGTTPACLEAGLAAYGTVFPNLVSVSSTRVAEFSKLLENIYRSVNIGLVNEMKVVADEMNVDIWEVIEAAKSKPFGYNAFYPGPGLGGHCIPIDPFYLTWKAREFGIHTRFIELAGEVNESMPSYVVRRVTEALNRRRKPVMGSRILLMGLAYKADVDDMRESPTFALFDQLKELGGEIAYFDPHIPEVTMTREHSEWAGMRSITWERETVSSFDCVVIVTNHRSFDLDDLVRWAPLIIDTRNALQALDTADGQVVKA